MSARVVDVDDRLVTVRVVGKLEQEDVKTVQQAAVDLINDVGKIRILILAEDFEGWGSEGNWGDVTFQARFDQDIEKMAIVGEQRWEDVVLMFTGKGVRQVAIEYFLPTDIARAREWLAQKE